MSISDFNRSNPFVITMRAQHDVLTNKLISMSKAIFFSSILSVITGIVIGINFMDALLVLVICIFPILYQYLLMRNAMSNSHIKEINAIVFGDEYKDININNEKILEITVDISYYQGKADFIREYSILNSILYLIIIAYILLVWCSQIF